MATRNLTKPKEANMPSFTPYFSCTNCVNFPQSFVGLGQQIQGVVMVDVANDDSDITFNLVSYETQYGTLVFDPPQVTIPANATVSDEFTLTVGADFTHPSIAVRAISQSPNLNLNGVLTIQSGP
jgi:hypothetical protein